MNSRERFIATMKFERSDRIPLVEWDFWGDTWENWKSQGAPFRSNFKDCLGVNEPTDEKKKGGWNPWSRSIQPILPICPSAKIDFISDTGIQRVPLNSFIYPLFESKIIEERNDVIVSQDERGAIREDKKGNETLFNIIGQSVNNREDWERVKVERLSLDLAGRLPRDWDNIRETYKNRDYPLAIGGHSALAGFFHPLRYLLGPVNLLMGFYDNPDLIRDIMNHLCDLQIYLFDIVLSQIDVDLCFTCEDLAYKNGPFISPSLFSEFMLPCYKRLSSFLKDHNVDILFSDNDGAITDLIPLFMEGGVTAMGPMEVAAGMDVVNVRKQFPKLAIIGGIDKSIIAQGSKNQIDEELEKKVPEVIRLGGGYIPTFDHSVPPNVPWDNYAYYRHKLTEIAQRLAF